MKKLSVALAAIVALGMVVGVAYADDNNNLGPVKNVYFSRSLSLDEVDSTGRLTGQGEVKILSEYQNAHYDELHAWWYMPEWTDDSGVNWTAHYINAVDTTIFRLWSFDPKYPVSRMLIGCDTCVDLPCTASVAYFGGYRQAWSYEVDSTGPDSGTVLPSLSWTNYDGLLQPFLYWDVYASDSAASLTGDSTSLSNTVTGGIWLLRKDR